MVRFCVLRGLRIPLGELVGKARTALNETQSHTSRAPAKAVV